MVAKWSGDEDAYVCDIAVVQSTWHFNALTIISCGADGVFMYTVFLISVVE